MALRRQAEGDPRRIRLVGVHHPELVTDETGEHSCRLGVDVNAVVADGSREVGDDWERPPTAAFVVDADARHGLGEQRAERKPADSVAALSWYRPPVLGVDAGMETPAGLLFPQVGSLLFKFEVVVDARQTGLS